MAYSTIVKPSDYFNTKLYSGSNGTQSVTGVGFQPDWSWLKCRSTAYHHRLFDAVRGAGKNLRSDTTNAEQTIDEGITAFNSDGFSVKQGSDLVYNASGQTYVSWNWKANGAGSANTDGSISSTVSANTTAGFSIVKWTGNGGTASVGHGLGVKPNIVIKKNLAASTNWIFSTTIIDGSNDFFYLNTTAAKGDSGETAPTASLVNLYANSENNGNGNGMIAYCFAEKKGYSKFGTYTANNSADGPFVYTGFSPRFIIIKGTDNSGEYKSWCMFDTTRQPFNLNVGKTLYANRDYEEGKRGQGTASTTIPGIDILSNGFKLRMGNDEINTQTDSYIYMAFAEAPLVANSGTNGVPATAR